MARPRLPDKQYAENTVKSRIKRRERKALSTVLIKLPRIPKRPNVSFVPDVPIDFDELIEDGWGLSVNQCCRQIPESLSKAEAQKWVWNESDEYAISQGCRFSLRRAMHFAYVCRNEFRLWENEWGADGGEPFILRTWEVECDLRIFGWVRRSEKVSGRWVRRFSKASTWVAKKNGKSPRGAAHALYLWKYDGTWKTRKRPSLGGGQHVYCIAKNGKQAKRVWSHAKNMVEKSPILNRELMSRIITKNEQQAILEYQPSHSILSIVTGDDQRSRDAAEGLNARGVICDEAHVVDDRMIEVTRDAGASAEDYLWSQISTYGAGDGYGKKDLDYGRDVATCSGGIHNDAYFFKTYECPQDSSDADIGREEILAQANPNLGNTVSLRGLLNSYEECKDDPAQLSGYRMRRANIWQRAHNPMFIEKLWLAGASEITHASIAGVGGGLAFDLAKSEDWASMAIAWDENDFLHVWCKIWTCEAWIEENSHRGRFKQWQRDGHLEVFDGNAFDFEVIQSQILELAKHVKSGAIGFDDTFGAQMGQNIAKALPHLHIGTFNQSTKNYAVATSELKNAVKNGKLRHQDNPALDWQAGHVMSKEIGVYEKPVKPERDGKPIPYLKIDSIQAITMAIDVRNYAVPNTPAVASVDTDSDHMKELIERWS